VYVFDVIFPEGVPFVVEEPGFDDAAAGLGTAKPTDWRRVH